jgi:hypothetical protein
VASENLGGLGARDGAPVLYSWVPPNFMPQLVPWLAMLLLLLPRQNRSLQASWIWMPLAILAIACYAIQNLFEEQSGGLDYFFQMASAFPFGVAATLLLAPFLKQNHRILTCLTMLVAMAFVSLLAFMARLEWDADLNESFQFIGVALALGVFVLVQVVALTLGGLMCRHRYSALRFVSWQTVYLVGLFLVISSPFMIMAAIMSPISGSESLVAVGGYFLGLLVATGISLALWLPFLILAWSNKLFHERLMQLLHVPAASPPALNGVTPSLPVTSATGTA